MAYADDILVFLTWPDQFATLFQLFALYSQASNVRLNRRKTVAVSWVVANTLNGNKLFQAEGILHWQDRSSPECTVYLGYPLNSNKVLPHFNLERTRIVACTILSIWKAHWRYIFDNAAFVPQAATAETIAASLRIAKANDLVSRYRLVPSVSFYFQFNFFWTDGPRCPSLNKLSYTHKKRVYLFSMQNCIST